MDEKLWQGRFSQKTDIDVEKFTASIQIDRRLYAYDIRGSMAHCRMLARVAIISAEESQTLIRGLENIGQEIEQGRFEFDDSLEDIHMHVEARLQQLVGNVAQKLHTARSRNDQVALDIRMFLRHETRQCIRLLADLRRVLMDLAAQHLDTILPGYTHLQRAQPVLLAHHLMAYYDMFARDAQRLTDCLARINVMPLGAAALAGTTYPVDRAYVAELLDFPTVSTNSIDSVADRDFSIEFVSAASIGMVHLSRLSEELILWSSSEFGFITLADAFATGSSIMPQKKNPDVAELVRGKSGSVFGHLIGLLSMLKGLPLAYNRDMQEDKQPVFEALDTFKACVAIYVKMLPELKVNRNRMMDACNSGFLNATDLADYLVRQGMPFRRAHGCVGQAVGYALSQNKELHELSLEELQGFSNLIAADVFDFLTPDAMINRRESYGGTARANVEAAITAARDKLARELSEIPPDP